MRMPFSSKWASLALLSVIVPVSLLATFRLTGVLPEPLKPETITVEAVTWNMSRPSEHVTINQKVMSSFSDSVALIKWSIHIGVYTDDSVLRGDYLDFRIAATANVSDGFVNSVDIRFSQIDTNAFLDIIADLKDTDWVQLDNLEIKAVRDSWWVDEPYINAIALDRPQQCFLRMAAFWKFLDKNELNHWIIATLEVTYSTETKLQKVIIPIQLGVLAR